jgi:hypothetical protein
MPVFPLSLAPLFAIIVPREAPGRSCDEVVGGSGTLDGFDEAELYGMVAEA